jgi:hypothetical protein
MLDMRKALEDFNRENAQMGLQQIRIGIGGNSGQVVVGNIGSRSRMEYTIIGDAVNATQRIEDLCKEFKWDLLVSDVTYAGCEDLIEVGTPHRITLRGRAQETLVYPVLSVKEGAEARVGQRSGSPTSVEGTTADGARSPEGELATAVGKPSNGSARPAQGAHTEGGVGTQV